MSALFDQVFRKIATDKNYKKPNYPQMDNWAISSYNDGDWVASMSDAGYSRWVGKRGPDGKVLWRVNDYYPKQLEFCSITEEEFLQVAAQFLSE